MNRRSAAVAAVVAAWVVGLALLVRRDVFRTAPQRLAEAALRVSPGVDFYAVEAAGAQIGYASSTIDTTTSNIHVIDYLVADLPAGGTLHRASARIDVRLSRTLKLRGFDIAIESESGAIKAVGRAEGDSALVLTIASGDAPADTQRITLAGPIIFPTLIPVAVALGETPKVGKVYRLTTFDPTAMAPREVSLKVQAESLFVVNDSAAFDSTAQRWAPVLRDTVRAWQLISMRDSAGPGNFSGWIDAQGRVVEATQGGQVSVRRMAYELAFENWRAASREKGAVIPADRDILETTAIGASALRHIRRLDHLRVRLSGIDLRGYDLDGGRQRLRGDTLVIASEGPSLLTPRYTLPASAGLRARFRGELAAEPLLQVGSPAIVALARRIVGRERDPATAARMLSRWLHDSLEKRISFGLPSATQVLRARGGDCNEHTQLFLALARSLGLPSRVAAGLALIDGKFYYHAWPEVYLADWVAIDPTFGEFPADAAHLRFITGGITRQAELLRLIGTLKIDVLRD